MYEVITFEEQPQHINDFLRLPKLIYGKKELMQNEKEESALLHNKHVLSQYFTLHKFLLYRDNEVAARCILTKYPQEETTYLGFFECIDEEKAAETLFSYIDDYSRAQGWVKIIGPVNSSFWLSYRLKINLFENGPYLSEPYNKDYYLKLFLDNGYHICETYLSNKYHRLPIFRYEKKKYRERYKEFTQKGYTIASPRKEDFEKALGEVYDMLMELYYDFPIFQFISKEDFTLNYNYMKYVADMSMIKMAYYQGKAVGFFIGFPDYRNALYGKITFLTKCKVALKKIRSRNYVLLYMGVKKEHQGLGKAMVQTIMEELHHRRSTAIGALIKVGKVTETYVQDEIADQYQYVLLEKKREDKRTVQNVLTKANEKWAKRDYIFTRLAKGYVSKTFGETINDVYSFASCLLKMGLEAKNIAIIGDNSYEWMVADLAIIGFVGVSVMMDKNWGTHEIKRILKNIDISAILYTESKQAIIEEVTQTHPDLITISLQTDWERLTEKGWNKTLEGRDREIASKIVFSSGTTGIPKASILTQKNMFAGFDNLIKRAPLNERDICYLFLPLHHTYAGIYNFLYSLVGGWQIYLCSDTKKMTEELGIVKPTIFCAVSLIYERFYQAISGDYDKIHTLLGGNIQYLFCGGSFFPTHIRKFYKDAGLNMMEAYALTETASSLCIEYSGSQNVYSVGTIFEDLDVKIIDKDKEGNGEIIVKGDSVCLGYYGNQSKTKEAFDEDGYFHTGDIGHMDENRELYLTGRKKRVIIRSNGENVYPDELESLIRERKEHWNVKVYEKDGEITADIYTDRSEDAASVIGDVNHDLPKYKKIESYHMYHEHAVKGM